LEDFKAQKKEKKKAQEKKKRDHKKATSNLQHKTTSEMLNLNVKELTINFKRKRQPLSLFTAPIGTQEVWVTVLKDISPLKNWKN
jgi:hypothetical protein